MSGGMIVRMVDLVLILLFGFIGVSDIQIKRQIKIPGLKSTQDPQSKEQHENVFLVIEILRDGTYILKVGEQAIAAPSNPEALRADLRNLIRQFRIDNKRALVVINPEPDATMQQTIDVFDICEQEGLNKSINFHLADQLTDEGKH